MNTSKSDAKHGKTPARKRRWPFVVLGLLVLPVALWFLVTSGWFLRQVVLPRVAKAAEADISVGEIRLRPFSSLLLTDVSVQTHDEALDIRVARVEAKYNLRQILGGTLDVEQLWLVAPVVRVRPEDLPGAKGDDAARESRSRPTLRIGEVRVDQGSLLVEEADQVVRVEEFELLLRNLHTGAQAELTSEAKIEVRRGDENVLGLLMGIEGGFVLNPNMVPTEMAWVLGVDLTAHTGLFAEAAELGGIRLEAEMTPTEIQASHLRFLSPNRDPLGDIRLSGPFDPEAKTAALRLQVDGVGATALNLFGAAMGASFGETLLSADVRVEVDGEQQQLSSQGWVRGEKVSVRREDFLTPEVSFEVTQDFSVDVQAGVADLRAISAVVAGPAGQELLRLGLASPTQVQWSGENPTYNDLAVDLQIEGIELADWRALLIPEILGGRLQGTSQLRVANQGKDLRLETDTRLRDLRLTLEGEALEPLHLWMQGVYVLQDQHRFAAEEMLLHLDQGDASVVRFQATGEADFRSGGLELTPQLEADLAALLAISPVKVPELDLREGAVRAVLSLRRAQGDAPIEVQTTVHFSTFQGAYAAFSLDGLGGELAVTADVAEETVRLTSGRVRLTRGQASMASVAGSGTYDVIRGLPEDARLEIDTVDLAVLYDWLQPEGPEIRSGVLQGTLVPTPAPRGRWLVKTDLHVREFLAHTEHTPADTAPIDVHLQGEIEAGADQAALQGVSFSWTPEETFPNRIQFEGVANWSRPEALAVQLTASGDRLNLTPWLMMFAAPDPAPRVPEAGEVALLDVEARPQMPEPDAMTLPLEYAKFQFTANQVHVDGLDVDRVHVDVEASARVVELKGFRMHLNDSAFTMGGKADVSMPGYQYEGFARLEPLDLEPFLEPFAPGLAGRFKGKLALDARVQGRGVTGPSFKEYLQGHMNVSLEEAELAWTELDEVNIEGVRRAKNVVVLLVRAIAPVLAIPPSDLLNPPIHELKVNLEVGQGILTLKTFRVVNNSFRLRADGTVQLADQMEASRIRDIPVVLGLGILPARQARVYREDRIRGGMVELPPFIRVSGTLGDPEIDVQRRVITGLIVSGVTESELISDERAQRVLGGIGGVLSGEGIPPRPTPTPRPAPTPTPVPPPVPEGGEAAPEVVPTPTPRPSRTDRFLRGLDSL